VPWEPGEDGELDFRKSTSDRVDAFLVADKACSGDAQKTLEMVERGWSAACALVRTHRDAISSLANWLDNKSVLTEIEIGVWLTRICGLQRPCDRAAATPPVPAPARKIVTYRAGQEPFYRDRFDGLIGPQVWS
jgi:hypothetical protein